MGVNWNGISVFESGRIVNNFSWANIVKLSFKRRTFLLRIKSLNSNNVIIFKFYKIYLLKILIDTELSFNAILAANCKMLWKSAIEHHTFFRLIAPPVLPHRSLFHLGSKFRYRYFY